MKAEATPWRALLAIAGSLGITPVRFWRLSLKEWRALVAPARSALSRDALQTLVERFPDKTKYG